jgi:hypothetical protein
MNSVFLRSVLLAGFFFASFAASAPVLAAGNAAATSLHGDVRDRLSGLPINGAAVALETAELVSLARTTTRENGVFVLSAPPDRHRLRVRVETFGYSAQTIDIPDDNAGSGCIHVLLERSESTKIGHSSARLAPPVASGSGFSVSSNAIASQGALRLTDALKATTGITVLGDASAPGGDAYVSLRGLRPSESQTFLDGHPIGPIGVEASTADTDGTIAGFNFQDAPYFALRNVDVSLGAGGRAPLTSDAIGGAIDLLTILPTATRIATIDQGLGNDGRASSSLRATGTSGAFGYVLVDGVVGTAGLFSGSAVAQTGLRGTDFTTSTLKALTYASSGDYQLRNDLLKLRYSPSASTSVLFTAYGATSWADKTGEGDNDYLPAADVLASAPIGLSPRCPRGVLVTNDGGSACLTPAAYAQGASGPAGGGPGAWQALRNQDDDLRISRVLGKSVLTADAFNDEYAFDYNRDASSISGPLDAFLERWSTQGVHVGDQITTRKNQLDLGLSWLHQVLSGDGTSIAAGAGLSAMVPVGRLERRAVLDDTLTASDDLTFTAGTSVARASNESSTQVDPRVAILKKLSVHDSIRFTVRRSTDEPGLGSARLNLLPAGAINPDCGAIDRANSADPVAVNVGSGPGVHLVPETGSDLELGYDRQLGVGGSVNITAYDTNVRNRIVSGDFAAGSALPASATAPLLSRIDQFCGISPKASDLIFTLARSFNAATARLRGIELGGRIALARRASLHYAYDVQSIVLNDLPASVLKTDATLVNGLQVFEVPLQKATFGVDVMLIPELSLQVDAHAVGPNNPQQLPGYAYADASLSGHLSKRLELLVSASNVLNSHVQRYGLIGLGVPYATNIDNAALGTPFLEPFNERYGLAPAAFGLRLTATL